MLCFLLLLLAQWLLVMNYEPMSRLDHPLYIWDGGRWHSVTGHSRNMLMSQEKPSHSALPDARSKPPALQSPEGPSTQYLMSLVPKAYPSMVFGAEPPTLGLGPSRKGRFCF